MQWILIVGASWTIGGTVFVLPWGILRLACGAAERAFPSWPAVLATFIAFAVVGLCLSGQVLQLFPPAAEVFGDSF